MEPAGLLELLWLLGTVGDEALVVSAPCRTEVLVAPGEICRPAS